RSTQFMSPLIAATLISPVIAETSMRPHCEELPPAIRVRCVYAGRHDGLSVPIVYSVPATIVPLVRARRPRRWVMPPMRRIWNGPPLPALPKAEAYDRFTHPESCAVSSRLYHFQDPPLLVFTHTPSASTVR